jgi:hypothetical protein
MLLNLYSRLLLLTGLLALAADVTGQAIVHKPRVLFIGNSYTYVNNLPQVTADIVSSAGDTLIFDSHAVGGYTLQLHSQDSATLNKIATGNWDYVVLQEQSQLPSFSIGEVDTEVFPYARYLDSFIHHYNSCARTMFYMTWGRKNGDTSNCAIWPPVCTYFGMDSLLHLRYMMMADSNSGVVSPVGAVWRNIRANYPSIELYQSDESHPSGAGTYAAACTFYTAIFKKSPVTVSYNYTLPATDAANIRMAVKDVVYDSLSKWHIGQYDPAANFTYTVTAGNHVAFSNASVNALAYYWDFGDGLTSVLANPVHNYSSAGVYPVRLVANRCSISDTSLVTVTMLPSGIGSQPGVETDFTIAPNPATNSLIITSPLFLSGLYHITIVNCLDQVVHRGTNTASEKQVIDLRHLHKGVYIISVIGEGNTTYRSKFIKD